VETGYRSSDIDVTDFDVVLGDICEKIQALRYENVPLNHYTFQRKLKKIRGNIVHHSYFYVIELIFCSAYTAVHTFKTTGNCYPENNG